MHDTDRVSSIVELDILRSSPPDGPLENGILQRILVKLTKFCPMAWEEPSYLCHAADVSTTLIVQQRDLLAFDGYKAVGGGLRSKYAYHRSSHPRPAWIRRFARMRE
jgi:hypothetical protein